MEQNAIITEHKLDFLSRQWSDEWNIFKIGTCGGQWSATEDAYIILSFINDEPGNGHLNDVFEWFEHSCKRDKKNLIVMEVMNEGFYMHLLTKRGFIPLDASGNNVIKIFEKKKYVKFRKRGNHYLLPSGDTKN